MNSRALRSGILSLVAENDSEAEAEWDLPSRQLSQLSEVISSDEINEQVGQDEVTGGTGTVYRMGKFRVE
jgi:hypothetical protein